MNKEDITLLSSRLKRRVTPAHFANLLPSIAEYVVKNAPRDMLVVEKRKNSDRSLSAVERKMDWRIHLYLW